MPRPLLLVGENRRAIFFADLESIRKRLGVTWPRGFDFEMIVAILGPHTEGSVVSTSSSARS